jgi:hypothetical protein
MHRTVFVKLILFLRVESKLKGDIMNVCPKCLGNTETGRVYRLFHNP